MTRRHRALVQAKSGIKLDLSLGGQPDANAVTVADLKMDPLRIPFPVPDATVHTAVMVHLLEYLDPAQFFRWMDELHRVMRPGGLVFASGPYGGDESQGWLSDPTHRTRIIEQSFSWFDPRMPFYALHPSIGRPTPKPWHVLQARRAPGTHGTVSYEVILSAQVSAATNGNGHRPRRSR
jgi:SAM-dependent methyltransferase